MSSVINNFFRGAARIGASHTKTTSAKQFYANPGAYIFYGIMGIDAAWVVYNGGYYSLYAPGFSWTKAHSDGQEGPYHINETAQESLDFGLPMPWQRRQYMPSNDPEEFRGLQQIDSQSKIAGFGS